MQLKNSTILITGGSSGIGLELVAQLTAQQAARIIITGRDATKLEAAKRRFPHIHTIQSDVAEAADIDTLYTEVAQRFPALNILINNAGIMRNIDLLEGGKDLHDITREIDIDLSGPIRMVQRFLPQLMQQPNAAIVNVTSGIAFNPFPISPIYSAAKAGLRAYTRALRVQLKKTTQVKVFELAPPGVDSPLHTGFEGVVDKKQFMTTEKLAAAAIQGILRDTFEIVPGLAKVARLSGRLAPDLTLHMMDSYLDRARAQKKKS